MGNITQTFFFKETLHIIQIETSLYPSKQKKRVSSPLLLFYRNSSFKMANFSSPGHKSDSCKELSGRDDVFKISCKF